LIQLGLDRGRQVRAEIALDQDRLFKIFEHLLGGLGERVCLVLGEVQSEEEFIAEVIDHDHPSEQDDDKHLFPLPEG
jgi:hypothetical protein